MPLRRYTFLAVLGILLGLLTPALLGGMEAIRLLRQIPASAVAALFTLTVSLWCLNTYRIRLLLNGHHALPGFLHTLRLYMAVEFASKSTPLGVAAPIVSVKLFSPYGVTGARVLAIFTATALLDALALLVLLTACSFVSGIQTEAALRLPLIMMGIVLLCLLLGLGFLYIAYRQVIGTCRTAMTWLKIPGHYRLKLLHALLRYRRAVQRLVSLPPKVLGRSACLSLVYWALHLSTLTACVWALGSPLDWFAGVVIQTLALTGGQLTMLPGGSGGTEAFGGLLITPMLGAQIAAAAILLWRVFMFHLYLLVGGICMLLSIRLPNGNA